MANEGQAEQIELNFEPIRGYPELRWAGKRPFRSTYYYPAQLRERHGEPGDDGWRNKLYWGDNLQVLAHLVRTHKSDKVKLIYIDPPYDSKADYKKRIELRGQEVENDRTTFEEKQYADIWSDDDYLQFMYERLVLMRELLAPGGSVFVHVDWRRSHHLRGLLDEVFGPSMFKNSIVWAYGTSARGAKAIAAHFARNHDDILWYQLPEADSATRSFRGAFFEREFDLEAAQRAGFRRDDSGRWFKTAPRGDYTDESIARFEAEGRIHRTASGAIRIKYFLEFRNGKVIERLAVGDTWTDIADAMHLPEAEIWDYPTQKPEKLLARIIAATTDPGDLVFDAFMGSGTTQAVAMKLGRRFLGCDINLGAIHTTVKRLNDVAGEMSRPKPTQLDAEAPIETFTAFDVYTVNHYDVFRNEVEAKPLLMEALAITPTAYPPWEGTKFDADGHNRMVKVMPINRIATRADLNDIVAGVDVRRWDAKAKAAPNEPVERITLICMGHEPDLRAHLEAELRKLCNAKYDIEVVDVLRSGANLQFKRESEAQVSVASGKLSVDAFFPMNLLQKLSLDAQQVADWKELVDSVMIDWNYDGAVFTPTEVDVPEGRAAKVKGVYNVPKDHGEIRIKITDVLSESWEATVWGAA